MFQVLAYLAIAAAIFAGGYGLGAERTSAKVADAALTQQKQIYEAERAADQKTFDKALASVRAANSTNDAIDFRLGQLEHSSASILERVNRAPRSVVCINSGVVRAYLDGLRVDAARAASAPSVPATTPHGLP